MLIETDYRALYAAGQDGLPLVTAGGVVAIGNFDGVHLGHRALLQSARAQADKMGVSLSVLTFTPHPRFYFRPDQPAFLLTDAVQKQQLLQACGVDAVVELKFDALLAELSPAEFVGYVLRDGLSAVHVTVGKNFVFGKNRAGDVAFLKKQGEQFGFSVTGLTPVADLSRQRLSSENIRASIRLGHMATAEDVLGRPWQIRGEVQHGQKRGRSIGFPTANLALGDYLQPKFGVYTARITIEGEEGMHQAVMNIGLRPTVGGIGANLEAHLLDFDGDLYGKTLRVNFGDFLRPEQKFADLNALKEQLQQDKTRARQMLG